MHDLRGDSLAGAETLRGDGVMAVTAIYRAIMLEVESRRLALGFPMERFSEWAGLPDRYYPKALMADTPSGRQASWETLQTIVDALFPHGFDLIIKAKPGKVIGASDMKAQILQLREAANPQTRRERMAEIGRRATFESRQLGRLKLTKRQRKKIARMAAIARWQKKREARAAPLPQPVDASSASTG